MAEQKSKKPLGIYVHIPFCIRKCNYCDFLSGPADTCVKNAYVSAVLQELDSYKIWGEAYQVQTIYFGGGTPSLLEADMIERILLKIQQIFYIEDIQKIEEITLEMNPKTADLSKCQRYKEMGINRISIGLQSTFDEELQLLGRAHNYKEFLQCYEDVRNAGFENVSIDIMSALPGQTREKYAETVKRVCELSPQHISSYSLIVEEGTPFWEKYGEDKLFEDLLPDEETDRAMYEDTKRILQEYGYHRYEISNYAKQGYESKHNSSYWIGTSYIGIGLGASSYFEGKRYQNTEEMKMYLKCAQEKDKRIAQMELISKEAAMEEFMFLGLRMMKGISESEFEERFDVSIDHIYGYKIEQLKKQKLLWVKDDQIGLTDFGIDVSNQVFQEFLLEH